MHPFCWLSLLKNTIQCFFIHFSCFCKYTVTSSWKSKLVVFFWGVVCFAKPMIVEIKKVLYGLTHAIAGVLFFVWVFHVEILNDTIFLLIHSLGACSDTFPSLMITIILLHTWTTLSVLGSFTVTIFGSITQFSGSLLTIFLLSPFAARLWAPLLPSLHTDTRPQFCNYLRLQSSQAPQGGKGDRMCPLRMQGLCQRWLKLISCVRGITSKLFEMYHNIWAHMLRTSTV